MMRLLVSSLVMLALLGCTSSTSLIEGNADAVGTIASVQVISSQPLEVRVLLDALTVMPESGTGTKMYLSATAATPIFTQATSGKLTAGAVSDLVIGAKVYARVGGEVIDTAPPQYGAERIEIIKLPDIADR